MANKEKAQEMYCNNLQYTSEGLFDHEKTVSSTLIEIDEIVENYEGKNKKEVREFFNQVKKELCHRQQ